MQRGEWWLEHSYTQYADGDIGDMNHEGYAFMSALGIDWEDPAFEGIECCRLTPQEARRLRKMGVDKKAVEYFSGMNPDARLYAMKEMGWVRAVTRSRGATFQLWQFTDNLLKRIQNDSDLWDDEDVEDTNLFIDVEELSTHWYETFPAPVFFKAQTAAQLKAYAAGHRSDLEGFAGLNAVIAKKGKVVTVDGKALKKLASNYGYLLPDENVMLLGPMPPGAAYMMNVPLGTFMVYVFETPEAKAKYIADTQAGKRDYLLFKHQYLGANYDAISEIWQRRSQRNSAAGMVAVAQVWAYDPVRDGPGGNQYAPGFLERFRDVTYVNMMSVRPSYQRNRMNAALIATILDQWPRKLVFSKTTQDGAKFKAWLQAQGVPCEEW